MTPTSGKRKRKDQLTESDAITGQSPNDEVIVTLQALFRQHFETSFEPLEVAKTLQAKGNTAANDISSDDIISGWSGLSEEDDEASQITYHSHPRSSRADIPREELKTFMVRFAPLNLQQ